MLQIQAGLVNQFLAFGNKKVVFYDNDAKLSNKVANQLSSQMENWINEKDAQISENPVNQIPLAGESTGASTLTTQSIQPKAIVNVSWDAAPSAPPPMYVDVVERIAETNLNQEVQKIGTTRATEWPT